MVPPSLKTTLTRRLFTNRVNFTRVGPWRSRRLAAPPASSPLIPFPCDPSRGVGSFPSLNKAAISRYAFLRCGEVSSGRLARLRRRHKPGDCLKTSFQKQFLKTQVSVRACSSASPDAIPGASSPIAARGSVSLAEMSSHIEFRAQVVSLSSESYSSVSAVLAPPAFLKSERGPRVAYAPRPLQRPGHSRGGVPTGRCWLFQDFSLRRLLPRAPRSDTGVIINTYYVHIMLIILYFILRTKIIVTWRPHTLLIIRSMKNEYRVERAFT